MAEKRDAIQLERLTLREIRMPLVEPFRISSGETSERRILLLELVDASGSRCWSECVAGDLPNYSPETIDTCWFAIEQWLAPRLLGRVFDGASRKAREPGQPEEPFDPILLEVEEALCRHFRGHHMARAALEMGAWGLLATKRGVPLAALLEGQRETIATGISIGIQRSPDELIAKVEKALEEGYCKIKIKIQPGSDLDFLRPVRAAFPDAPLMADANNAYTLNDLDTLEQLDPLALVMVEQPLAWDDVVQHAALQVRLETPVCLDESITGVDRARDMIQLSAGRIINIKPGRVGGFLESRRIHDLAERHDVPVWCGGMLESGIGRAYNVALASLSNFRLPGDVSPSARYWKQDIVTPQWTMDRGHVTVPTGPGLGVEVDVERIEALSVRSVALRSA